MSDIRGSFEVVELAAGPSRPWLLPSTTEMSGLDTATIEQGTSGRVLMERAGAAIVEQILIRYPAIKRCAVLCGPGNNGGDGLVITRLLRDRGIKASCVVAWAERYSKDCIDQISLTEDCLVFGGDPLKGSEKLRQVNGAHVCELLKDAEILVDALLGTGQRAEPRGAISDLIELSQAVRSTHTGIKVVAVDIPTGLDADTGRVFESHIPADTTLTVQFVKRGMLQFPGRSVCGDIKAVPIGITETGSVEFSLATTSSVPRLPPRNADVHKGALGRVVVVGGSLSMPGAPMLSALGALRTGAGIVSRVVRRGWSTIPALPEAMFEVLDGSRDCFSDEDVRAVSEITKRFDVAVIGPGIGTAPETGAFLQGLISAVRKQATKIVLDADALNLVATYKISLTGINCVITPHPGEAGRLLGVSSEEIQVDRFSAVRRLSNDLGTKDLGGVAVLKGAGTIVHDGREGRVVADGTPYLAAPGSGDVLSGIIGACAAKQSALFDAATTGVWIHAKAGVSAAQERGGPILASEIAHHVAEQVRQLEGACY